MSQPRADYDRCFTGFPIPDLPEDASDEEIRAALAILDRVKTKIFASRKALEEEAREVFALRACAMSDEEADEKSSRLAGLLLEAKKSIAKSTGIGDL